MKPREHLRNGGLPYVVLWVLAVTFVALALADVPLLGIEPPMLAVLAAVFAASTATVKGNSSCNAA